MRDGFSGVLVDGHDPADYAAAVRSVLPRRELMAAGARRHAAGFSWERTADSLVAAYTSAAGELAVASQPVRERLRGPLRALPGAQVGTREGRGAITDATGRFRITGLITTPVTLTARLIGYGPVTRTVVLGDTRVEIVLAEAPIQLNALIVTATAGGQQKRAMGTW